MHQAMKRSLKSLDCVVRVLADVAHELSLQIGDRSEDAARGTVAFDLGEPQLDLVEPRRIGPVEVHMDSWVPGSWLEIDFTECQC